MRERGVTLVELAVVVVCIGIMAGVLLGRVLPLIGLAERTAFEQVRGQLASALLLEAAQRVVRGESASLAGLDGSNPMDLLLQPPANYAGSVDGAPHAAMPRRSWYFDERSGLLVYRAGRNAGLGVGERPVESIALRVRFAFQDGNGDAEFDPAHDRFDGLVLEPVEGYARPVD